MRQSGCQLGVGHSHTLSLFIERNLPKGSGFFHSEDRPFSRDSSSEPLYRSGSVPPMATVQCFHRDFIAQAELMAILSLTLIHVLPTILSAKFPRLTAFVALPASEIVQPFH